MKLKLLSTAFVVALISSSASADEGQRLPNGFFVKPYIGAEYQFTSLNYADQGGGINGDDIFEDNLHGGNVHAGLQIHRNLGFELGYTQTENGEKENVLGTGANTKLRLRQISLDALGYLPVTRNFDLIGTAGITRTQADTKVSGALGSASDDDSETNWRAGGGAQVWLTDNTNIRGLVRYQEIDGDVIDNAVTANIGLNYQF